jgi:hypothetical protein
VALTHVHSLRGFVYVPVLVVPRLRLMHLVLRDPFYVCP